MNSEVTSIDAVVRKHRSACITSAESFGPPLILSSDARMCTKKSCSLLLVLLCVTTVCSELLQETCVRIDGVALKGQEFRWVQASDDKPADVSSCRYTSTATHFISQEIPLNESQLNATGFWNFQCTDGNVNGTVSVVPGLHIKLLTATVPQDCYAIGTNDVVLWLDGDDEEACQKNIVVENDAGNVDFTSNLTGKQSHYQFTRKGIYYLTVTNLPSVRHTIVVVENDIVNITEDYIQQQCASVSSRDNAAGVDCDGCSFRNDIAEGLLFSHASVMSVSFGILLPVGAMLAASGSPFAHKIFQPGGIILGIVGCGLVFAYIEVEEKRHFNSIHSFVGFFLVLLIVLMPFMRLRRELHYVHKKCGVIIVFYGMTNVLLGLVTVGCAPVYVETLYGAWLILTVIFYVFWRNSKDHKKRGKASSDESCWSGCCLQTKPKSKSLGTPINIRRLSRNVIDEDKFVTLRDISEEELHRLAVKGGPTSAVNPTTVNSSEQQPPLSAIPHTLITRSDSLRVTRHSERAKDYDPLTGTFRGTTPSPNLVATTTFDHVSEHSDEEDYSEEMKDKFYDSNDNVFAESPVRLRNGGALGSGERRYSNRSRTRANTLPVDFEQSWELHKHRRFSSLSSSGEAILCADRKGNITYWGDGAVRMFGYTPSEALGCSLKMLIPSEYQERHQNGLDRSTESTIKYLRKHQYAPEFQKHARLYEVKALSKNGEKFPVEVHVSSFVVDEEIHYAAILKDMSQPKKMSISSSAGRQIGDKELRIKKKALLVGATMKFTHKLTSPEYITKEELRKVMSDSMNTENVETGAEQIDKMINDIVKAGGGSTSSETEDSIGYLDLLKILSQHGLHIKESGLIGRHFKRNSKTIQLNRTERLKEFFVQNHVLICWLLGYLILNIVLYIGVSLSSDSDGWKRWASGTNSVLCMNFLLILLPVLRSILDSLHSHTWLSKVLPLGYRTTFHLFVMLGIFFWCAVHVTLHLCSYAIDNDENKNNNSTMDNSERLREKLEDNPQFLITGVLTILLFLVMSITSIKRLQIALNSILFYTIHFVSSGAIYLLIFIHGSDYINTQFWKWLIPIAVLWIFELLYRRYSSKVQKVNILEAHTTGNVVIYKVAKPNLFKFAPGQFVSVKFPNISSVSWNHCQILSAPSDKFLSLAVENKGCWGNKIYKTIFAEPYSAPVLLGVEHYAKAYLNGPYGEMKDVLFDYQCSLLVCEDDGLFVAHSMLRQFTQHIITNKGMICKCRCAPTVSKLFFIWVSRNRNPDHQWFVDFLTEIIEGGAMPTLVDARVYFTDSEKPPDDLASLMLNLGLAMSESNPKPQLRRKASTGSSIKSISVDGVPDFEYILQGIQAQNLAWEVGVFSLGNLHTTLLKDLKNTCSSLSESAQSTFEFHHITINK